MLFTLGLIFALQSVVNQSATFSANILQSVGFLFLITGLTLIIGGVIGIYYEYFKVIKTQPTIKEIQQSMQDKLNGILESISEIENSGTYLINSNKDKLLLQIETLQTEIDNYSNKKLQKKFLPIQEALNEAKEHVLRYNPNFVQQRKKDYAHLWIKGKDTLDDEQQTAIVTDDKYNLVVAAAGSGKTEVLITRIAYLTQRQPDRVQPNRILAIAYQRKAREQIEQRLREQYRIDDVCVRTFHKLGKDILEQSGRKIDSSDIIDENKKFRFVKSYFEERIAIDPEFYKLFIRYITTIHNQGDPLSDEDKTALVTQAKMRSYISIDGTKVKSKAEKEIMDYLLTNKINREPVRILYETNIEGFRPDFHLPQYDLFIEHWGINRDGEVPTWFSQSSQEYTELMENKKNWFSEHKRLLIETFAYEYNPHKPEEFTDILKDRILKTLEKKFPESKFEFSPLTYEELVELVWASQKTPVDDIKNFITTAKTYGLTPEKIEEKLEKGKWSSKQLAFGKLALQVFRAYQAQLEKLEKTDFEDMINEAAAALDSNKSLYETVYDQILIDEYQDISAQRIKLLKRLLRKSPNCKLFCVGDDWQSIMSFSGSNLNYFVNFEKYFKEPAITRICTNYRSIKSIVEAGASVIKNNGGSQVQKPTRARRQETKPIFLLSSPHKADFDEFYYEQTANDCFNRINGYLAKGYAPNDILVLTRYMRTRIGGRLKLFRIIQKFSDLAGNCQGKIAIDNAKEPNAVKLLTVHKCKGLEAKVVFILNVVKGEFGFPSEIEDNSILEIAREDNGIPDQKEEERRLFYVAITRAKEDLYIYSRQQQRSEFLNELAGYTNEIRLNY